MKRNPGLPRIPRTFVIRVLVETEGYACDAVRGQISEPTSDEGWQATFANADELWALMRERLEIKLRRNATHSKSSKPKNDRRDFNVQTNVQTIDS